MSQRLKMSMFAVLLTASAALADTGGLCGLRAGCLNRDNYGRCIQCCYANGCQINSCIAACWNHLKRYHPGRPNVPYNPNPIVNS